MKNFNTNTRRIIMFAASILTVFVTQGSFALNSTVSTAAFEDRIEPGGNRTYSDMKEFGYTRYNIEREDGAILHCFSGWQESDGYIKIQYGKGWGADTIGTIREDSARNRANQCNLAIEAARQSKDPSAHFVFMNLFRFEVVPGW